MNVIETDQMSELGQRTFEGLRTAVSNALDRKRRLGQYYVVWLDKKIQRIEPDHEKEPNTRQ